MALGIFIDLGQMMQVQDNYISVRKAIHSHKMQGFSFFLCYLQKILRFCRH